MIVHPFSFSEDFVVGIGCCLVAVMIRLLLQSSGNDLVWLRMGLMSINALLGSRPSHHLSAHNMGEGVHPIISSNNNRDEYQYTSSLAVVKHLVSFALTAVLYD